MTDTPPIEVSQCQSCLCMTHTHNGKCGKCGAAKTPPIDKELQKVITEWLAIAYDCGEHGESRSHTLRSGLQDITRAIRKFQPTQPAVPVGDGELRDWDAYFVWNTVYLLRTLKVMDTLTPIQHKVVEEHCKLRAATVRQDIEKALAAQAASYQQALEQRDVDSRVQEQKLVIETVEATKRAGRYSDANVVSFRAIKTAAEARIAELTRQKEGKERCINAGNQECEHERTGLHHR